MARDGSGTYSVPNTFTPNTVMSATAVNQNFTDAGTALTGSLARDGQAAMTGQFKAIAGSQAAPGVAFGVDTNTGFRRASEDEIRIVTGGVDRFYIDSTGKAFALFGMNISGDVALSAPVVVATTSASLLTLRRTENDTTARIVESLQSGSGAGASATLEVVGDGNNAVQTMRWRVNSAAVFEATQSLLTADVPLAVGSSLKLDTSGFIDLTEIATPSNPAANIARLYAVDVSGVTKLQFRDSAGTVTTLPPGADLQTFTASGTWTKPLTGTVALIQVWSGGGSGGRGGAGDGGGGGGGGGYLEALIAVASLSAAVSVTIGAGGTAQSSDDTNGNVGGSTSFGAYLASGGGGAGGGANAGNNGGGGGGGLGANAGAAGSGTNGGDGGAPRGVIGAETTGGTTSGNANPFGGGKGGSATASVAGGVALHGGGGGGGGSGTNTETAGGSSIFGGGGGGGGADTGTGAAGGTAVTYGGNGGAGNTGAGAGTAGTAPGGGGGGTESAASGAGARGECRVMVW